MKISKFGVLGLGAIAALGIATPGFSGGNKYEPASETQTCGDATNTVNWFGAQTLWPPNHKMQDASITAIDSDGALVELTVTPKITDAVGGDGGTQHDPDVIFTDSPAATGMEGEASVPFQVRSERSGKGEGRTYTFDWTARFTDGTTCSSGDSAGHTPFVAKVPHDMRDKNN